MFSPCGLIRLIKGRGVVVGLAFPLAFAIVLPAIIAKKLSGDLESLNVGADLVRIALVAGVRGEAHA
jgi:hypothetical protein